MSERRKPFWSIVWLWNIATLILFLAVPHDLKFLIACVGAVGMVGHLVWARRKR